MHLYQSKNWFELKEKKTKQILPVVLAVVLAVVAVVVVELLLPPPPPIIPPDNRWRDKKPYDLDQFNEFNSIFNFALLRMMQTDIGITLNLFNTHMDCKRCICSLMLLDRISVWNRNYNWIINTIRTKSLKSFQTKILCVPATATTNSRGTGWRWWWWAATVAVSTLWNLIYWSSITKYNWGKVLK